MPQCTPTEQLLAAEHTLQHCGGPLIPKKYSIFIFPNHFHAYVHKLPLPPTPLILILMPWNEAGFMPSSDCRI